MSVLRGSIPCSLLALLFCIAPARLLAQNTTSRSPHCFSIHVRLNGKPIEGPQAITLKTKQGEDTVSLDGGCFTAPAALFADKAVDVFFTVPGNKIYLAAISPSFFTSPWDIDLEDKKFDSDVSLPRHARIREACAVVFHGGEPENALTQTGCRTPLPDTATKRGKLAEIPPEIVNVKRVDFSTAVNGEEIEAPGIKGVDGRMAWPWSREKTIRGQIIADRPPERILQAVSHVLNKESFLFLVSNSKPDSEQAIIKILYEHHGYSDLGEELLSKTPMLQLKARRDKSCDETYASFIQSSPTITDDQEKTAVEKIDFLGSFAKMKLSPEQPLKCYKLESGNFEVEPSRISFRLSDSLEDRRYGLEYQWVVPPGQATSSDPSVMARLHSEQLQKLVAKRTPLAPPSMF